MRKQTKIAALVSAAALLAIGASMTSLARGWVPVGDDDYQWLDAYGDPVYDEWKLGNDGEWYYLGEDGYMLRDVIFTDTEDHTFYVKPDGRRMVSEWLQLSNDDSLDVNNDGEEESVLWMYFGSDGRAYKASSGDYFVAKEVEWSGGKNYFLFSEDGYMMSGWVMKEDGKTCRKIKDANGKTVTITGDLIYYLGTENEGWARTGWQEVNMPFDHVCPDQKNTHWFYFDSTGKAYVKEDGEKYIGNKDGVYRWYSFGKEDEDTAIWSAILREGWTDYDDYGAAYGTASTATPPAISTDIYNDTNGSNGYGWVYADDVDAAGCWDDMHVSAGSGSHWYYLVTYRSDRTANPVVRSIPFNSGMKKKAAKSINGKTYLFDTKGRMMYGLQEIAYSDMMTQKEIDNSIFKGIRVVELGYDEEQWQDLTEFYYFNDPEDAQKSTAGQMTTGRVTLYDEDDSTVIYNYNFAKQEVLCQEYDEDGNKVGDAYPVAEQGMAYKNTIVDGSYYDYEGKRVDALDGNSYQIVPLKRKTWVVKGKTASVLTNGGDRIVVSSSGRVKNSGTVRIDGVKYTIKNSVIVAEEY